MISCGITNHLIYCLIAVILSAFINGINISVRDVFINSIFRFTDRVIYVRTLEEKQKLMPGKDLQNMNVFDTHRDDRYKNFLTLWTTTYLIAAIVGAIAGGYFSDKIGRKKSLIWSNGLILIAVFFISFSARFNSYEFVIIGQILIGINTGMNTCLAPIYLTEVSPVNIRGIMGAAYIVATSFAILITQIVITCFGLENWIYMFSSVIIPSILMFVVINECPESPKYSYIITSDQQRAQNALQKLRESSEVNNELYDLKVEYQTIERSARIELYHLWNDSKTRNALFISVIVAMSRHSTGISGVRVFAESIYTKIGLSEKSQSYLSIAMLIVSFKTSLIFMFLVEKLGRRTLLLIGLLGMFCSLVFLSFCLALTEHLDALNYLNLITLFLYIILYSCGPYFIPNFFFAEIFRTDSRSVAGSVSVVTLYAVPLIVRFCFISIQTNLEVYILAIFATFTLILWIIIYKKVPETKGKTIEEIIYEL